MRRWLAVFGISLLLLGCRLPPDREDLKLLDERQPALQYPELYLRARSQATLALEAFYADAWVDLDTAARALEQSARFLPKAQGVPANDTLVKDSEALRKDAVQLGEAARARDVRASNEILQRIQLNIRSLRTRVPE